LRTFYGPLSFAGLKLVGHLVFLACNRAYGYFGDEFYYIACGRHPAFGYVDHPPAVPLVARAGEFLFGDSVAGVRVFPALASTAVVLLTGALAREMRAGAFAQALACLLALLAPVFLRTGLLLETVEFDQLMWALVCFCVVRFLQSKHPGKGLGGRPPRRWLSCAGVLIGLGGEVKYTMFLLAVGLLVGFVLTPARRHLVTKHVAIGLALGVALVSPNLVWQLQHGWPTLEFLRHEHADKMSNIRVASFALDHVGMLHLFGALVALLGLFYLLALPHLRPLGIAAVTVLLLLLGAGSKPYYFASMVPVLLAAGSAGVEALTSRRSLLVRLVVRGFVTSAATATGIALLPSALPVLPPDELAAYLRKVEGDGAFRDEDSHRVLRLPQDYAAMMGWDDFVGTVANVYAELPGSERPVAGVLTSNWTEAGAIDLLGAPRGLPRAMSGNNNYYLWGPTPAEPAVVVAVGFDEDELTPFFEEVVERARVVSKYARESDVPVTVCRRPRRPFASIFPRFRHYD
jgi:hypothetical protein